MSKLLKLKEWATLDEAAMRLSVVLNELVTVVDLYQLALNEQITLSVNFVNHTNAKIGKVLPYSKIPKQKAPTLDGSDVIMIVDGIQLNRMEAINPDWSPVDTEAPYINFGEKIYAIDGVWDLAMMGGEVIHIERLLQNETSGIDVELISLDGIFLKKKNLYAQYQSKFEDDKERFITKEKLLLQLIEIFDFNRKTLKESYRLFKKLWLPIPMQKIKDLYILFEPIFNNADRGDRKEGFNSILEDEGITSLMKKHIAAFNDPVRFYPSDLFSEDWQLVIRTEELQRFIDTLSDNEKIEKPLSDRERTTFLNIIGSLIAVLRDKNMSDTDIYNFLEDNGYTEYDGVSKRTLEAKFAEAKRSLKFKD